AATREQTEAIDAFLGTSTFFSTAKTWTPNEARRELPNLAQREGRVTLQPAWSSQLENNESLAARRHDRTLEAIAALALTPSPFVQERQGRRTAARATLAEQVLRDTADAHLGLVGYTLKKVDPLLNPRNASEHAAERAAHAPWLLESLRREDLQHAL